MDIKWLQGNCACCEGHMVWGIGGEIWRDGRHGALEDWGGLREASWERQTWKKVKNKGMKSKRIREGKKSGAWVPMGGRGLVQEN